MTWGFSHLLYVLAIISLIIAIVLAWKAVNGECHKDYKRRTGDRAHFFFWAAIALGVLGLYQQGWDASVEA